MAAALDTLTCQPLSGSPKDYGISPLFPSFLAREGRSEVGKPSSPTLSSRSESSRDSSLEKLKDYLVLVPGTNKNPFLRYRLPVQVPVVLLLPPVKHNPCIDHFRGWRGPRGAGRCRGPPGYQIHVHVPHTGAPAEGSVLGRGRLASETAVNSCSGHVTTTILRVGCICYFRSILNTSLGTQQQNWDVALGPAASQYDVRDRQRRSLR